MFRLRFWTAAIVAAVAALASPGVSEAAFRVKIEVSNGVTTTTHEIIDGGANDSDMLANGEIDFESLTVGGLNIFDLSASANYNAVLDRSKLSEFQSTLSNTSGSPLTVVITSWATFDLPDGNGSADTLKLFAATDLLAATLTSGTYGAYFDTNATDGVPYASGVPILVTANIDGGSATEFIADPPVTWALKQVYTLKLGNGAVVDDLNGSITVTGGGENGPTLDVPAPGGLIMALGVVPFFGVLRRRLRKSEPTAA